MRSNAPRVLFTAGLLFAGYLLATHAHPAPQLSFEPRIIDAQGPLDIWLKAVGDLNGDRRPDLIAGGHVSGGLVWYENPSWKKQTIAAEGAFGTDGEVADVDRDGDLDVVAIEGRRIVWYDNPRWEPRVIAEGRLHDIEVADFDGDGRVDVAARNQGSFGQHGDTLFFFGQEAPDKWTARTVTIPDGEGLLAADIDGDKDLDIVIERYWFENPGAEGVWTRHEYAPKWDYRFVFVAVGDLNGDGRPDIALAPSERAGSRYRMAWFAAPRDPGSGAWTEQVVARSVEAVIHFAGAADFDDDGRVDLVTAAMKQGTSPDIAVYRNEGEGARWTRHVVAPTSSHSMRIVDVDGDGRPDLYGANWRGDRIVRLWRNRAR